MCDRIRTQHFGINLWTYQRLYLKFFSYHRNLENQLFPMVLVRFFQRKNSQSYRRNKSNIFCFSLEKIGCNREKEIQAHRGIGFFGFNLRTYYRLYWIFFSYHLNLEKELFLMAVVRFFQHKNSQSYRRININLCKCYFLLSCESAEHLWNQTN